jgi:2,3-bisphosphoglycerate-independent phosphoglycerate mutase
VARIKESYNNGITDEFIIPFVVVDGAGKPVGQIRDEDVCINFNFAPTAHARLRACWRARAA